MNVTGRVSIPAGEIKNGNTPFGVATDPPELPIPGALDWPNPGWTEIATATAFATATITLEHGGSVVLTVSCTFDSPTSDGAVAKADV